MYVYVYARMYIHIGVIERAARLYVSSFDHKSYRPPSQRIHVGIQYVLGPQKDCQIITFGSTYVPYRHLELKPFGTQASYYPYI